MTRGLNFGSLAERDRVVAGLNERLAETALRLEQIAAGDDAGLNFGSLAERDRVVAGLNERLAETALRLEQIAAADDAGLNVGQMEMAANAVNQMRESAAGAAAEFAQIGEEVQQIATALNEIDVNVAPSQLRQQIDRDRFPCSEHTHRRPERCGGRTSIGSQPTPGNRSYGAGHRSADSGRADGRARIVHGCRPAVTTEPEF